MKQLNVVITSGGTQEYIDDVRVLSNISSGKLGSVIANEFINGGHEVTYVAPKNAVMPRSGHTGQYAYRPIKDTQSVMEVMEEIVPKADVVIQAMAVSDFTFDLESAIKLSSGDPEAFIEHMRKTIKKTPKIIANFTTWNPKAILVGFKFTVGKSKKELLEIAMELMKDNKLNMVLANDKEDMKKNGAHVGMLITNIGMEDPLIDRLRNKEEIAERIYNNVIMVKGK
jgi:phosphopantothenate--cysteine ligase